MMYEIWCEGYANHESENGPAHLCGKIEANSFKEACDKYFSRPGDKGLYDGHSLSYWACRLFDNEVDARKSHG